MSYDSSPDAERITKLATHWEAEWASQRTVDELQLSYILMRNRIDTATSGDGPVKRLYSGIGGINVNEDAALLVMTPQFVVNPPTDKEEDVTHANALLEPWLSGAFKLSQSTGKVWQRLPRDGIGLGRMWSNLYPIPSLWASAEYKELTEKLVAAEDEEEIKRLRRLIQEFKRDRFPIKWQYVNPVNTYSTFQGEHWLPEVIQIIKMRRDDIEDYYGKKALPGDIGKAKEIKVIRWANHQWCADILPSKNDPKIAKKWEHGMGMNPYILGEVNIFPENDENVRWFGSLFYSTDVIETYDTMLTDMRNNIRENTRTGVGQWYDPKLYDESLKVAGRPRSQEGGPGEVVAFWVGEDTKLLPVPELNPQYVHLLQTMESLIMRTMIRPVERGEAKSGTSQNQFVTQVQIAEREFDPALKALRDVAEGWGQRCFASVEILNSEYPDDPDGVAIYGELRKGILEVKPKDVKGWRNAVQARISRAIPIDRNVQVNTAVGLQSVGVPPIVFLEQELGYEDPERVMREGFKHQMRMALQETATGQVQLLASQMLQEVTPAEIEQLIALMAGASPQIQALAAAVQQMGGAQPPPGPVLAPEIPSTGLALQGISNERRAGVPQLPQLPTEAVMPPSP